jgi:hypothetical protein
MGRPWEREIYGLGFSYLLMKCSLDAHMLSFVFLFYY